MPASPRTSSTFNVARNDGTLMPVMVADLPDGQSRVVTEFVSFLRDSDYSLQKMKTAGAVLGFLNDYLLICRKGEEFKADEIPAAINHFLRLRRYGDREGKAGLGWSPMKAATVARDARFIADFSKHCSTKLGYFPLVPPVEFGEKQHRNFMTLFGKKSWRLLSHLDNKLPVEQRNRSPVIPERPIKTKGSAKPVLTEPEVKRIIDSAGSLSHKALFILCAYGGPRLSEALNIWTSDLMPGRYRNGLFGRNRDDKTPLVVLAHPSQSTFIAVGANFNEDRQQHLFKRYGLNARNLIQGTPMFAGWKGMLADDESRGMAEVFWTSESMAILFSQIVKRMRLEARNCGAGQNMDSHPYLFINDTVGKQEFGMPTKISNAKKSFARACSLADIRDYGQGIHLLRHFYKATLVDMGIKPETIKHAMHHRSLLSQVSYGVDARKTHEAIAKAMQTEGRNE